MQHLPLPIALGLSVVLGTYGMSAMIPDQTHGQVLSDTSNEQCEGYALLHLQLSSLVTAARFLKHIDHCVETLSPSAD